MLSHTLSIDEDGCLIIDGSEVEEDVLAFPSCRDIDAALVPEAGDEVGVLHSREAALRAEGHGYLAVEALAVAPAFLSACLAEVEAVRPSAVEVYPVGTLELRTWVLAAGEVRRLNCAAQTEQQKCCNEQLAEMFHNLVEIK